MTETVFVHGPGSDSETFTAWQDANAKQDLKGRFGKLPEGTPSAQGYPRPKDGPWSADPQWAKPKDVEDVYATTGVDLMAFGVDLTKVDQPK